MVGHHHELGQGWIPEDGIVRQRDVCDVKVDEFGAVVVAFFEGDREADLPYRCGGTVGHSRERFGRLKLVIWDLEVVKRVDEQDVEPCAAVDEGLGNLLVADDW